MNLQAILELWKSMGERTLGLIFLQTPVPSVLGETIFPPAPGREMFFQSLPASGGKDFMVQDGEGRLARIRLAIMMEEVKVESN